MTGMIRWNANFVSALAQSVLERARIIRGYLSAKPKRKPRKSTKRVARKAK